MRLARNGLYRVCGAADLESRRRRIIDNPGGNDHDDKQPEHILAEAAENHRGRLCRFAIIARGLRQYLTISVEFLGQHRCFGLVLAIIYVARPARQNNSRNFQCSAADACFVLRQGSSADGLISRRETPWELALLPACPAPPR